VPVTIHVNGRSNSLAHKGSMGIAKSTLPDVCKTPSPGGPVPVPYPIILSMTSDLTGGTTTVKADGGNMAAVKGSELSRCNGDEPGTAGGVKSSTNMKEATWILYSFDVKLDGKNACRLTDKMQMNHGNTACLGGIFQDPVTGVTTLYLDCRSDWDDCQKEQMKAKADVLDLVAQQTPLTAVPVGGLLRAAGRVAQRAFRALFAASPPAQQAAMCVHGCGATNGRPMDADHVLELQLGGAPAGPLRMLDASVNRSCGAQIRHHGRGQTINRVEHRNC
jgi:hypothetical protein